MIEQWAAALEATDLAVALRNSVWSYPLVNAAHLLGVALLVGSIVPLDLRLLGVWRSVPLAPLGGVLSRIAGTGLVLAMIFGTLLFITRASEYIASNVFISKMVVVAVGTANALALRMTWPAHVSEITSTEVKTPARLRFAAGISLATWLAGLTPVIRGRGWKVRTESSTAWCSRMASASRQRRSLSSRYAATRASLEGKWA